jgi:hydrogenase maturation protease
VSAPRAVLIGIGNLYRRDDGIGPALIAAVAHCRPPGVPLIISDGEPSQLLDAWHGTALAVVVDAVLCDVPQPGRIHRAALGAAPAGGAASSRRTAANTRATAASTHGLGIPDAIRLAEALDRAPRRLVVFAVEAADLGFGSGLSPAVAACLPELTRAVLAELETEPSREHLAEMDGVAHIADALDGGGCQDPHL